MHFVITFSLESLISIKGGIGPAGLSAEDLHVLDLTQQRPRWHRLNLLMVCFHLLMKFIMWVLTKWS